MSQAIARPSRLFVLLVIESVLAVGFLIVIAMPLMMSPMMFDSGETQGRWIVFTALWLSPLVVLAGTGIAWLGYALRAYWLSMASLVVSAVPIAIAAGTVVWVLAADALSS
jgi:hypothetical protein